MEPVDNHGIEPANVAMLCNGNEVYGIGTIIKLYAQGMPRLPFFCFSDGPLYQWLRENRMDVTLFEGLNGFQPYQSIRTLLGTPQTLRRTRQDAAKLHEQLKPRGIKILHTHRLAQQITAGHMRKFGYKTAWQINNNMDTQRLFGIGQRLNWALARWGADVLLPASDFIAKNWTGSGVPSYTIRNAAAEVDFFSDEPLPLSPLRCVVAGRLEKSKGHHTAVQAVLIARGAGCDVTLDIYGGPIENNTYVSELRKLIRDGEADEAISLKGFCNDLRQRHPTYHLGLQCRIDPEPCSLWVCETMVDGLPILASATGGTPELVDEGTTGFLYPPGDEEALGKLLIRAAKSPQLISKLKAAALQRGKEHFSRERFCTQTMQVYQGITDSVSPLKQMTSSSGKT